MQRLTQRRADTSPLVRVLRTIVKHMQACADELEQINDEQRRWDDDGGAQPG